MEKPRFRSDVAEESPPAKGDYSSTLEKMAELRHAVKPTVNRSGLMYSNAQSISAAKGTIADTSGDGFLILP